MTSPVSLSFNLPFEEAIKALENRNVVLPEKYYSDEFQGIHRQLSFSIAGVASLDQLQLVLDSLTESLSSGSTFAEWQKNQAVIDLGLPAHRRDNIYRTAIQSSCNRGRWERFQDNKENSPYLLYDAVNDTRTRPSHAAMDGIIRKVDDPFWNTHYPPNGFRCRCRCIQLSKTQAEKRSKDGEGLNKTIDESVKPDAGWSYNVGKDLTRGVTQAIQERRNNPAIEPQLLNTLELILKLFEQDNE